MFSKYIAWPHFCPQLLVQRIHPKEQNKDFDKESVLFLPKIHNFTFHVKVHVIGVGGGKPIHDLLRCGDASLIHIMSTKDQVVVRGIGV